ncbi:MAG: magnesium transporter [Sphingomonadales bacterium BRH_c42]|nr:MAG: magnesium transporter [Sphingomonadales bacterium BRH_c42]
MPVVAALLYRDGKSVMPVSLDQPVSFKLEKSEFVWIGLVEPTEAELWQLQHNYDLHPLAVEDALKAHQLPKVEIFGDQLFVTARTVQMVDKRIEYGETAIFVSENFVISVRHGSTRGHSELRQQLEAAPSLLRHGVDYVLHGILDFIVEGYFPITEAIEDEVLETEQRMLDSFLGREEIGRLFELRRELIYFQRILGPMSDMCQKLAHLDLAALDPEVRPYFSDVYDHVRRVESRIASLREILLSVFEASNLLEQQRQGTITRQLAAWAAILAVPTAIAGIYGMNFDNMPELSAEYGYFITVGVVAALCAALFIRFRKLGWL